MLLLTRFGRRQHTLWSVSKMTGSVAIVISSMSTGFDVASPSSSFSAPLPAPSPTVGLSQAHISHSSSSNSFSLPHSSQSQWSRSTWSLSSRFPSFASESDSSESELYQTQHQIQQRTKTSNNAVPENNPVKIKPIMPNRSSVSSNIPPGAELNGCKNTDSGLDDQEGQQCEDILGQSSFCKK